MTKRSPPAVLSEPLRDHFLSAGRRLGFDQHVAWTYSLDLDKLRLGLRLREDPDPGGEYEEVELLVVCNASTWQSRKSQELSLI